MNSVLAQHVYPPQCRLFCVSPITYYALRITYYGHVNNTQLRRHLLLNDTASILPKRLSFPPNNTSAFRKYFFPARLFSTISLRFQHRHVAYTRTRTFVLSIFAFSTVTRFSFFAEPFCVINLFFTLFTG